MVKLWPTVESGGCHCSGERRAVEDVPFGDLDLADPEGAHHLREDDGAGDDRRGAAGVEPGHPEPLGEPHRERLQVVLKELGLLG